MYTVYTVFMASSFNWNFVLSQADGRAMYQQIVDQVQQHVALGDLPPESKLPSIRELATTLKVSIITVKRAYLELERAGIIVTQHGKGSWVTEGLDRPSLQQGQLERHLEQAAELAAAMNVMSAELVAILQKHIQE